MGGEGTFGKRPLLPSPRGAVNLSELLAAAPAPAPDPADPRARAEVARLKLLLRSMAREEEAAQDDHGPDDVSLAHVDLALEEMVAARRPEMNEGRRRAYRE